jgi:hypothetical protein
MSAQVRERVSRAELRSVRISSLPFGLKIGELIAALLALALLVSVGTYYLSSLRPERERLRVLENELREQQKSIIAGAAQGGSETTGVDSTRAALETLESFRTNHLKPFSSGRIALIKQINELAKKHSVTLTSGIDMGSSLGRPDSESESSSSTGTRGVSRRRKADEFLTAIPSVAFRFSAFGQYPNLRAFINELEHEKQFLVINSITLANQEAKVSSRRSRAEAAAGIVLTIEMSAYFQPM